MNRPPLLVWLILLGVLAVSCAVDTCDGAPDCRAKTAQTE